MAVDTFDNIAIFLGELNASMKKAKKNIPEISHNVLTLSVLDWQNRW